MNKHKIGSCIATLRKEKGWTQSQLADMLQLSDKAVSKWESNKGDPSLEFLPELAKLFEVSLDYLMTGKQAEEKIVAISKIELCAKNDDVKLLHEFIYEITYFGDNGKELLDSVFKYQSVNVFSELLSLNRKDLFYEWISFVSNTENNQSKEKTLKYLKMLLITDNLSNIGDISFNRLRVKDYNALVHENYFNFFKNEANLVNVLDDLYYDFLITDKRVSEKTKEMYYDINNKFFYIHYPFLIDAAYRNEKDEIYKKLIGNLFEYLNSFKNDLNNFLGFSDSYSVNYYYQGGVNLPHHTFNNKTYSLTHILKSTLELMLKRSDYKNLELANSINQILTEVGGYRGAKLYKKEEVLIDANIINHDKVIKNNKLKDIDKKVLLCIYDDLVDLDKLIALDDYELYEETIKKYPASFGEIIYNKLHEKNYKWLFEYFLNKDEKVVSCFREKRIEDLERSINEYLTKNMSLGINSKYITNKDIEKDLKKVITPYLSYEYLIETKNNIFLNDILKSNKEIKFFEKALKLASQRQIDNALEYFIINRNEDYIIQKLLLDKGAKLHKRWTEDDGWGYMINKDEVDEVSTELLKNQIKVLIVKEKK